MPGRPRLVSAPICSWHTNKDSVCMNCALLNHKMLDRVCEIGQAKIQVCSDYFKGNTSRFGSAAQVLSSDIG